MKKLNDYARIEREFYEEAKVISEDYQKHKVEAFKDINRIIDEIHKHQDKKLCEFQDNLKEKPEGK